MDRSIEHVIMTAYAGERGKPFGFDLAVVCGAVREKLWPGGYLVVPGREVVIRQLGNEIVLLSRKVEEQSNAIDFNTTG